MADKRVLCKSPICKAARKFCTGMYQEYMRIKIFRQRRKWIFAEDSSKYFFNFNLIMPHSIHAKIAGVSLGIFFMFVLLPHQAALAANTIIKELTATPNNPFYIQIPGQVTEPTAAIEYKLNPGGWATVELTEQIKNSKGEIVYEFGNAGADNYTPQNPDWNTIQHTWNGKGNVGSFKDKYVPDDTYTFYVKSHVNSPPDADASTQMIVTNVIAPTVTLVSNPPVVYYPGNGNSLSFNYNLIKGVGSSVGMTLKINGPLNDTPTETVVKDAKSADGKYSMTWDGKMNGNTAKSGDYTFTLTGSSAVANYAFQTAPITGNFKVVSQNQPNPTFSNLTAAPNPYNSEKDAITFGYTLNGSLGYTNVNVSVYEAINIGVALRSWQFQNQASGTNSIVWDGMMWDSKDGTNKKIKEGAYIVKATGTDGNYTLVPQQLSFTVEKTPAAVPVVTPTPTPTPTPTSELCAGFKDVKATDASCKAIEYVKSIGAMTGNSDGTFNMGGDLQRDQIAKITLEASKLFNPKSDYCAGKAAFPDVSGNAWSYQYICRGVGLGMVTGYLSGPDKGFYRPERSVNRAEFLALISRSLKLVPNQAGGTMYDDVTMDDWFSAYALISKQHNLFSGNKLYPTYSVSRREVAEVLYKLNQDGLL